MLSDKRCEKIVPALVWRTVILINDACGIPIALLSVAGPECPGKGVPIRASGRYAL